MKIYLVRHGQSRWQVRPQEGEWNSPLTELGQSQAERLGSWLAGDPDIGGGERLPVTALHASTYLRAQQTAAAVAGALALPVHSHPQLCEADFLVSERLPSRGAPNEPLPSFQADDAYAALKARAQEVLNMLADSGSDAVMAISHGGLISTMLRQAAGSDHISFWIYNTSINLIEWKRGRWHLIFLNLWDHLPPPLRTY